MSSNVRRKSARPTTNSGSNKTARLKKQRELRSRNARLSKHSSKPPASTPHSKPTLSRTLRMRRWFNKRRGPGCRRKTRVSSLKSRTNRKANSWLTTHLTHQSKRRA